MVDARTLEKYEREAKEKNRESWALSWCMDTNIVHLLVKIGVKLPNDFIAFRILGGIIHLHDRCNWLHSYHRLLLCLDLASGKVLGSVTAKPSP